MAWSPELIEAVTRSLLRYRNLPKSHLHAVPAAGLATADIMRAISREEHAGAADCIREIRAAIDHWTPTVDLDVIDRCHAFKDAVESVHPV